ncbi:hypothetical protein [Clostridium sp.]|uniref:hypothetical protein n=1 Tax=Clostridium sp. TaxID=1506 RepID=UPI003D6CD754
MSKNCIFNINKICDNCGECEICEINRNKKCDNCGKCLELEGYDVKAIKIDEVFEHEEIEEIVEVEKVTEVEDNFIENDELIVSEEGDNDKFKIDTQQKLSDYDAFLAEEEILKQNKDEYIPENNEVWEYIDDVDGARELLENEDDNSGLLQEKFPGLIILNDRR